MIRTTVPALALAVILLLSVAIPSVAWDGPYYSGYCGAGLASWLYPGRSIYVSESIPYFALNPPVYYSYPVPRTYGYSPFAYPPGTMTPESRQPAPVPVLVRNPFLTVEAGAAMPETGRGLPLTIKNPYVEQPGR